MVLKRPPMCVIYTSHYDNNNNENTLNIHKTEKIQQKVSSLKAIATKNNKNIHINSRIKKKLKKVGSSHFTVDPFFQ